MQSEDRAREHSRLPGFPITESMKTTTAIDPLTAHS